MAKILHIETATRVCSVALSDSLNLLSFRESHEGKNHSLILTRLIEEVLEESGLKTNGLQAVSVSRGPGSYTGLRIGISTAKGICYALRIPLIAIDTLAALAVGFRNIQLAGGEKKALLCPVIDARRMEVYSAVYHCDMSLLRPTSALVVDHNSFSDISGDHELYFFGDGAAKCREVLNLKKSFFHPEFSTSARFMIEPAMKKFNEKKFEDLAYFEPFYLKDFIATTPADKLL